MKSIGAVTGVTVLSTGDGVRLLDFEQVKRQILDRVRIQDIVAEHVTLKRRGVRWVGLCPFHSEKTPSFTVSPERGLFKCFGCGKGGDVFSFVQLRENVSFMEAMRHLADRAGVEFRDPTQRTSAAPGEPSRTDLAKVNAWALQFFRSNLLAESPGRAARDYLHGRGFTDATLERFGLGLATDGGPSLKSAAARAGFGDAMLVAADVLRKDEETGRVYETFRSRLMFPIRDATGRVVGFGGRTLIDDKAKYLNTRQTALFDKGRNLYGIELAREAIASRRRAIVVEGYTDCMACHQAGFIETVATLGTALTDAHVDLLRRFGEEMVLLFDSDAAGEAAADRAIGLALPRCVKVRLARIPEGKDPSDFLGRASAADFSDVLNGAVDALEFKWSKTQERFRADSSDVRRREAVLDFVRVVADAVSTAAVDAIQRGLLVNQIAHLLRIEREEVSRLMSRSRSPRGENARAATGGAVSQRSAAPRDEEQAVWTHMLEVLLNAPDLLSLVDHAPDLARIADPRDRRIATALFDARRDGGQVALADVLTRCHDPADAQRVTELVERGAARGNFEGTLRLALRRLGQTVRESAVENSKQRLLDAAATGDSSPAENDARQTLNDGVKEHRHFAPRRLVRRAVGGSGLGVGVPEVINTNAVTE